MTNMMQAMPRSITLHALGLFSTGESIFAPYPREKKNTKEAVAAPIPKASLSSPRYLLEAPPISSRVSTYTCGLRKVKASAAAIVGPSSLSHPPRLPFPLAPSPI